MVAETSRATKSSFQHRLFCYCLGLSPANSGVTSRPNVAFRLGRLLPFHRSLSRWIRIRPRVIDVNPASLLMGCQAGLDPIAFADAVHSARWVDAQVEESPHVRLLRLAIDSSTELSDEEIKSTEYWSFARSIFEASGEFFGAHEDDEILKVTRNFIEWGLGTAPRMTPRPDSRGGDGILVARVSGTKNYQIIDGHHRAAIAVVRGEPSIAVRRTWLNF